MPVLVNAGKMRPADDIEVAAHRVLTGEPVLPEAIVSGPEQRSADERTADPVTAPATPRPSAVTRGLKLLSRTGPQRVPEGVQQPFGTKGQLTFSLRETRRWTALKSAEQEEDGSCMAMCWCNILITIIIHNSSDCNNNKNNSNINNNRSVSFSANLRDTCEFGNAMRNYNLGFCSTQQI